MLSARGPACHADCAAMTTAVETKIYGYAAPHFLGRHWVSDLCFAVMAASTSASASTTRRTAKGHITGLLATDMRANSRMTRCTDRGATHGCGFLRASPLASIRRAIERLASLWRPCSRLCSFIRLPCAHPLTLDLRVGERHRLPGGLHDGPEARQWCGDAP